MTPIQWILIGLSLISQVFLYAYACTARVANPLQTGMWVYRKVPFILLVIFTIIGIVGLLIMAIEFQKSKESAPRYEPVQEQLYRLKEGGMK